MSHYNPDEVFHEFELGQKVYTAHILRLSTEIKLPMDTPGIITSRYKHRKVEHSAYFAYRGEFAYQVLFEGQAQSHAVFQENLSAEHSGTSRIQRDERFIIVPNHSADTIIELNILRRQSIPQEYEIFDSLNEEKTNGKKAKVQFPDSITWLIRKSAVARDELGDETPDSGFFSAAIPENMVDEILVWLKENGKDETLSTGEIQYTFEDQRRSFCISFPNRGRVKKPTCVFGFRPKSSWGIHSNHSPNPEEEQAQTSLQVQPDIEAVYKSWVNTYKPLSQRALQDSLNTRITTDLSLKEIIERVAENPTETLSSKGVENYVSYEGTNIRLNEYGYRYYLRLRDEYKKLSVTIIDNKQNKSVHRQPLNQFSNCFKQDGIFGPIESINLNEEGKHVLRMESGILLYRFLSPIVNKESHVYYRILRLPLEKIPELQKHTHAIFHSQSKSWQILDLEEVQELEKLRYQFQYKRLLSQKDNPETLDLMVPQWLSLLISENQIENQHEHHLETIIYAHYTFADQVHSEQINHLWLCGEHPQYSSQLSVYWQSWDEHEAQTITAQRISIQDISLLNLPKLNRESGFTPRSLATCIQNQTTVEKAKPDFETLFSDWLTAKALADNEPESEILSDFNLQFKNQNVRSLIERYALSPIIRLLVEKEHELKPFRVGDQTAQESFMSYFCFLVQLLGEASAETSKKEFELRETDTETKPEFYHLIVRNLLNGIEKVSINEDGQILIRGYNKQILEYQPVPASPNSSLKTLPVYTLQKAGRRENDILANQSLANFHHNINKWEFHDQASIAAIDHALKEFLFLPQIPADSESRANDTLPDWLLKMMLQNQRFNEALDPENLNQFAFAELKNSSKTIWIVRINHYQGSNDQLDGLYCYCYDYSSNKQSWQQLTFSELESQGIDKLYRNPDFLPERLQTILQEQDEISEEARYTQERFDEIYQDWFQNDVLKSQQHDAQISLNKSVEIGDQSFTVRQLVERAIQEKTLRLQLPVSRQIPFPYSLNFQYKTDAKGNGLSLSYYYKLYQELGLETLDYGRELYKFEIGQEVYTKLSPGLNANIQGKVIARTRKCTNPQGTSEEGYAIRPEIGIIYLFGSEISHEEQKGPTANRQLSAYRGKERQRQASREENYRNARARIADKIKREKPNIENFIEEAITRISKSAAPQIAKQLLNTGYTVEDKPDLLQILDVDKKVIAYRQSYHFDKGSQQKWYFPLDNLDNQQLELLKNNEARFVEAIGRWIIEEDVLVTALNEHSEEVHTGNKTSSEASEDTTGKTPKNAEKPTGISIERFDNSKVPDSLRHSFDKLETKGTTKPKTSEPNEILRLAEEKVGELTGSVDGQAYCHGYAIHNERCVYINMLGARQGVEAIRASLSQGKNINLIPVNDIALELGPDNEQMGQYYAFIKPIAEAHVSSTILLHKSIVYPDYEGGAAYTYIFKLSETQLLEQLYCHLHELLDIAIFEEWIPLLWETGIKNNYLSRCESNTAIEVYALKLDPTAWSLLIQYALAHKHLQLPEAED